MREAAPGLLPMLDLSDPKAIPSGAGVLPFQAINAMIHSREIIAEDPFAQDQVQPASIDLRLGSVAYRVPASFLPGPGFSVRDRIRDFSWYHVDISDGAVLERGSIYIIPLLERVRLPTRISAFANPKSSTGRLDIFTRLITDRATHFDSVEAGYEGPLYAEVSPRTFSVKVRRGSRLNQLRFRRVRRGSVATTGLALKRLHAETPLVHGSDTDLVFREDSIGLTLDLRGEGPLGLVGYRAKNNTDIIDIDLKDHYDVLSYWDPIFARTGKGIVLTPDDFYILATKECVTVPPMYAAEMLPYDTLVGEFRVHYAGFFDPGFGYPSGTKAVLEVRSHEVPFLLEHEQIVAWLRYEQLADKPDRLYGSELRSHYQNQGLTLAKHFKPWR